DSMLLFARARVEFERHDTAAAEVWLDKLAALPGATTEYLNEVAWLHFVYDADPSAARRIAIPGLAARPDISANASNTIAAVEASSDHRLEGWGAVQKAFASPAVPRAGDWFVLGRIAETYGLRDDAIAYYRRVPPLPPHSPATIMAYYDLLHRRLAGL